MKKTFFFLFFITIHSVCWAQYDKTKISKKAQTAFMEANAAMRMGDKEAAKNRLQKAIEMEPNFCDALILLGDIFHFDQDDEAAIKLYNKAFQVDSVYSYKKYKTIAEMKFNEKNYDAAIYFYKKYLSFPKVSPPEKAAVEMILSSTEFIRDAIKHPVPFQPIALSSAINSKYAEYYPTLSVDGNTIIFTRKVGTDEDFYIAKKINGEWQTAQRMPAPLNSECNEGALSLTPDNGYVFFTRDDKKTGFGGFDIYISKKEGDKYLTPNNLGPEINTAGRESQPSFSSDGKTLYFMRQRKEGLGGADIYSSELTDKGWSTPKNLGPHINTAADEQFPFIHPDNQTLYFVSKGKPGMGKGDIFFSRKQPDGTWSEATNIGYPINTDADERGIFITADGKKAIYSKDIDGRGNFDLFEFDLYGAAQPKLVTYVKGIITDSKTNKPVEAEFQLIDLNTGKVITQSTSDGSDGSYLVCIPVGKDYALNVSNPNYLFYSDNFSLKEKKDTTAFVKNVSLMPIEVGKSVVLKNIFFELNKFDLQPQSKIELSKLLDFMQTNPSIKILVSGHTDNLGTPKHNLELSESRAKSVYDYLIQKGIAANRLSYKGYGEKVPIADNATEDGRQQNRRTQFTITEK